MSEPIRIIIEMHETGEVRVMAPLQNKLLCYGLLEMARQIVENGKPVEQSKIIKPLSLIPKNGN